MAVVVAVIAAGWAGSSPNQPPATPAAVTRVLTFQAFDDVGLLPHLVRTATVQGACPGGSAVHPSRADAWRCRAGDAERDPCSANHTGEELACAADPWMREVVALRPPTPQGRAGQHRDDRAGPRGSWSWPTGPVRADAAVRLPLRDRRRRRPDTLTRRADGASGGGHPRYSDRVVLSSR